MTAHSKRLTRLLIATAVAATAIAACGESKKKQSNPLPVYDDVYTTGEANNRIIVAGDLAYIVNSRSNTLDVVDLLTCTAQAHSCQRVKQVTFPVGTNPYDEVFANGKLWVTGLFSNTIYGIDPATGAIVATANTGAGLGFSGPQSLAVTGSNLLVSNSNINPIDYSFGPGFVSFVQGTSIVAQVTTSRKVPVGFTAWPDGNIAVVNNGIADFSSGSGVASTAGSIDILSASSHSVVRSIDLGLTLPGPTLAISNDGLFAFTGSGEGAQLLKINIATGAVETANFSTEPTFVSDVLIDDGVVYVLSFSEDRVYAVDADTLQPVFLNTAGQPTSFVTVGPGNSAKGPNYAAVWHHGNEKHLLVLLTISNSLTDVLLP